MRINARLDEELTQKLKALQELTKSGTTQIVKRAIDLLYHTVIRSQAGGPAKALKKSGLIGCGSSDDDLSSRYKEILKESLESKT